MSLRTTLAVLDMCVVCLGHAVFGARATDLCLGGEAFEP